MSKRSSRKKRKPQHVQKQVQAVQKQAQAAVRQVQARYDAAQTNTENQRHWAWADNLSADKANSPGVRRKLRNRARYERDNNSYCDGMVDTLANDCIGTGPRLQLLTDDQELNKEVEAEWLAWSMATNYADKLHTMRMAKTVEGEGLGQMIVNPKIDHAVKLDVALFETDRLKSSGFGFDQKNNIDGIQLDRYGNPESYNVFNDANSNELDALKSSKIAAKFIVHWFKANRPGQHRGVPELTPAIELFAQLRRYTLAVLGAAETAASFAAIFHTDSPTDGDADSFGGTNGPQTMDAVEIERRMATVMPMGWKMSQFKAEHPTTTYTEFVNAVLNEIARCLNIPFNVAAGNSKDYNYASGRLDHQTYFKSIRVEQRKCQVQVLDPVFSMWLKFARDVFPSFKKLDDKPVHQWFFDGQEHVDPLRTSKAHEIGLANDIDTLSDIWGKQGHDWRTKLEQRSVEKKLQAELGLTDAETLPKP